MEVEEAEEVEEEEEELEEEEADGHVRNDGVRDRREKRGEEVSA